MNITELDSYNLSDAVKFNKQLNPAIWNRQTMKPEVREHLLAIAEDFKEFLGLSDLEVKDITVSGSNAGYTYTPHSDIDLHLVVDIPKADSDDVYRELFDAKKYQYNDAHSITISGYDVELYVENANEPPKSQGIYSVLNNDWVKIPLKQRATINDEAVKSKFEDIGHRIESAVETNDFEKIDTLATKVKNFRQAGLDKHGELGPENLAYKMLRKQGLIKQLYDARTAAQDARLSLDERKKKKKSPVRYGYTFNVVDNVADAGGDVAMETAKFNPSDEDILKDFIDFCFKELKLKALPTVKLRRDPQWSVVHKTFGRYIDDKNLLEVAWGQRHIMDVLRTVAHELTHRRQHEREDVPPSAGETGSPYENEANARAGILMRDYARLHPEYFEAGQAEQLHGDEISESTDQQVFGIAGHKVILKDGYFYIYKGDQLIYRSPTPRVYTKEKLIQAAEKAINIINDPHKTFYKSAPGQGVEAAYKKLLQVITHRLDKDLDIDPTTIKNDIAITAKDFGVSEKELRKQWAKVKPYKYSRFPELFAPYSKFSKYFTYNSSGVGPLTKVRMSGGRDQWLNDQMTKYMNQHGINISESSGYIPTQAQAKLPQFSNALSVDVHPGQVGREANKLGLKTDSQGHPDLLIKNLANALESYKQTGQLITESEQLDEVRMAPSNLKQFADSEEANGILAGFEAEMIFRDAQGDEDSDDYEADYDADERCYSIDQVVEFFENDDYGYGLSRQRANRLRNDLDERYYEWWDERMHDAFRDEQSDLIQELLLEDKPMTERVHDALTQGHDYSDEEADKIIAAGGKAPRFTKLDDQEIYAEQNPDYEAYLQATEDAEAILEEEVQASIDNQDSTYDQAVENFRDNFQTDDSDFFTDVGLRWMSSVASDYDLDWPIMSGGRGNDGSREWADIAYSLSQATGQQVEVGGGYHQLKRGDYYVLEPDGSLSPDDPNDEVGLEIVSPPMPLNQAIDQLNKVIEWADGDGNAYTNSSTGLHMGISVPYKGGDVDYVKLALFMGDEHILEQFGRSANSYCASAVKKLKQNVAGSKNRGDDKITGAMELMKSGLIELAQRYVQQGVGQAKYTSVHIKPGYIEFRSPGGDYLSTSNREIGVLENTMRRFAYAMYLAGRPDLERKEYYKKLYKLIAPEGSKDLELFAKFSSGEITAEELKKQWAEKVIAKEVPITGKEKSNWKLYNRSTGKPVEGLEWNNYTELDALERAKARVSPASSMMDFKQAYELRDVGTNTGRWNIIRRDNNETLEVVDAATRGEAVDYAYDKYTDVIPFYVEPFSGDVVPGKWDIVEKGTNRVIDTIDAKSASEAAETAFAKDYDEDWYTRPHSGKEPEPKLSRRAKLATQIARPKDYVLVNKHSGLTFYTFSASSLTQAVDFGLDYLRNKGLDIENFSVQRASNVKQAVDNAVDSRQLQSRVEGPIWQAVYAPTGRVLDTITGVSPTEAGEWRQRLIRDHGFSNPDDLIVRRAETTQVQDPGQAQRAQNIRDAAPRADFELYVHDRPEEVLHSMDNATAEEVREFIARQERSGMPPGLLRVRQVTNETYNRSQQQQTQLALDTLAQKSGFKNFAAVPQGKVRIDIMRKAVDLLKKNTL